MPELNARPALRPRLRRLTASLGAILPLGLLAIGLPAHAQVVISQVYGGNGNSFASDYVELFNKGSTAASLTGLSIQYGSATGTGLFSANGVTALTGSLPAGGYYLVRLATTTGPALPAADATGITNLSGTAGKVVLVNSPAGLACNGGATPCSDAQKALILDLVGYGNANYFEGSAAAPAPTSTTALFRANNGCSDTGVNSADFVVAAPAPRSTATAVQACDTPPPPPPPTDVAINAIQGSGAVSPLANQTVRTSGVVTKLTNNGFFIQSLVADSNPLSSEGLFVFTGSATYPAAVVGNLVQVAGTVKEFNTGAVPVNTMTELDTVTAVVQLGSGYTVTPTVVALPEAVEGELERYEGMLVTLTGPFTVAQNFFQGRYGQLTLAAGGRLETPTNRFRPGSAQAVALADENARRRIVLDDGSSRQNPNPTPYLGANALPRAGDTTGSITGVIDFGLVTSSNPGLGDYKIHPTVAPSFFVGNPRSPAPEAVGGNLKVASFNVLNYFTTFTNGATAAGQTGQGCTLGTSTSAANCRGASNLDEFLRQRAKIVEAMLAIDADVLGLMEIQNNGTVAAQNLVDALNARAGAGTYAVVPDPAQGTGTDAIKVAMIHKPARVQRLGAAVSDPAPINNRPTLAQTFIAPNGEKFTLVVNHFKSKSCDGATGADLDLGDGQGCFNDRRTQQAQQLRNFVAGLQSSSGVSDVLLIGDLNAYAQEDPVLQLTGSGLVDQVGRFSSFGYSYVFDGAAGRLDHAIASATMSARVQRATHWHINADELSLADYNTEFKCLSACTGSSPLPPDPYTVSPYRSSDHDPVVLGLNLYKTIVAAAGSTAVTGSPGDDLIYSGAGRRTLTGGTGNDQFIFTAGFAGGATVTDFQPGADRISLAAVLQGLGIPSANPIGQGHVSCTASGADALIHVDPDAAGPAARRALILVKGQGCAVLLNAGNFLF